MVLLQEFAQFYRILLNFREFTQFSGILLSHSQFTLIFSSCSVNHKIANYILKINIGVQSLHRLEIRVEPSGTTMALFSVVI